MASRKTDNKRQDKVAKVRHKRPPIARLILYWGTVASLWLGIGIAGYVGYCAYTLPTPQDIRLGWETPAIILVARDGSPLYTIGRQRGEWLERDFVPPNLIQAVLATEDRRFYRHGPIDLQGVARAALANLWAGAVVEGGSTITQQLAKNLFLTPERTIKRKVQEILLAFWLESKYSKDDILTFYLNRVYLGGGAYGIDAAAKLYFGHGARNLSLSEAAVLTGLLKAPSRLNPHRDKKAAWDRAQIVLGAMVDAGYLTISEASAAAPPAVAPRAGPGEARYFIDWVRATLDDMLGPQDQDIFVRTTLDPALQRSAEGAVKQALARDGERLNASQAALLAMTPRGAVRAMVGGRNYDESAFNRTIQARRQTGSAFKLFVYLTAFESGLDPSTTMRDSPITLDGWTPQNYSGQYQGTTVTLETAFANSINTVAVKLSERVNRGQVIKMAKRLGVTSPLTPHPSLALGSSEMTLKELTGAYAAVANGGWSVDPYGILEVRTSDGTQLYARSEKASSPAISRHALADMQRLLVTALERGTGRAAQLGRPAAGKTGTSQDYRDAWFVGFTADLVAGVWVGNDDAAPMNRVTGGALPARLWRGFMTTAHQDLPPRALRATTAARAR